MKKTNKKGFTLAELLIVVAIIAVLVAIAIPIFTSQLEKSKEATDVANIRAAYAEVMAKAIENPDKDYTATVEKKQSQDNWQNAADIAGVKIAGNGSSEINSTAATEVKFNHTNGKVTIDGVEVKSSFVGS